MRVAHQEARKQAREGVSGLLPGTPVWVQHGQNAQWEPTVVTNKTDAPNSYWIMCEKGAQQRRVYRHTCTFLKIRSALIDGKQKAQMKEWRQSLM